MSCKYLTAVASAPLSFPIGTQATTTMRPAMRNAATVQTFALLALSRHQYDACAAGTWLRTVYVEYGPAASLLVRISPDYYTGGLALGEFIARACLPT